MRCRWLANMVSTCAPSRDRLKRERRDEFLRRAGQDHIHLCACLGELGCQVRGFIGGDGTGDAERDAFPGEQRDSSVGEAGHIF